MYGAKGEGKFKCSLLATLSYIEPNAKRPEVKINPKCPVNH